MVRLHCRIGRSSQRVRRDAFRTELAAPPDSNDEEARSARGDFSPRQDLKKRGARETEKRRGRELKDAREAEDAQEIGEAEERGVAFLCVLRFYSVPSVLNLLTLLLRLRSQMHGSESND